MQYNRTHTLPLVGETTIVTDLSSLNSTSKSQLSSYEVGQTYPCYYFARTQKFVWISSRPDMFATILGASCVVLNLIIVTGLYWRLTVLTGTSWPFCKSSHDYKQIDS